MTHKIIYLTICCFFLLSCKTEKETKTPVIEPQKIGQIDSLANRYLELNRFSGTILIAQNETIVYNKSYGMADYKNKTPFSSKTAFKVGEITQIVTHHLVKQLVQAGKVKLTDSLSKYLANFKSEAVVGDVFKPNPTVDSHVLGKLIEKVSNKSYQKNIEAYGDKLGLKNTYFTKSDPNLAVGYLYHNYRGKGLELQKAPHYNLKTAFSSTGIKSTAEDLVKILKSTPKNLNIDGYLKGDGFSYSLVNDTNNHLMVIVLSNRKHPVAKEISNSIRAILKNKKYKLPLARKPLPVPTNLLNQYIGKYSLNEQVTFEVVRTPDSLFVILGPNKVALIPQSKNQFYMKNNDASMRFEKDASGAIRSIRLLNGFIDSDEQALRVNNSNK